MVPPGTDTRGAVPPARHGSGRGPAVPPRRARRRPTRPTSVNPGTVGRPRHYRSGRPVPTRRGKRHGRPIHGELRDRRGLGPRAPAAAGGRPGRERVRRALAPVAATGLGPPGTPPPGRAGLTPAGETGRRPPHRRGRHRDPHGPGRRRHRAPGDRGARRRTRGHDPLAGRRRTRLVGPAPRAAVHPRGHRRPRQGPEPARPHRGDPGPRAGGARRTPRRLPARGGRGPGPGRADHRSRTEPAAAHRHPALPAAGGLLPGAVPAGGQRPGVQRPGRHRRGGRHRHGGRRGTASNVVRLTPERHRRYGES